MLQGGDASDPSSAKSPQQQQYQRAVAHVSVLQEKLEQLIGVHRQVMAAGMHALHPVKRAGLMGWVLWCWWLKLLRRYSGLEGEAAEARKKVGLRDDRIKQLEHSCRYVANCKPALTGKLIQARGAHGAWTGLCSVCWRRTCEARPHSTSAS